MFAKRKSDGVVINKGDFGKYLLAKKGVKALVRTRNELADTTHELISMRDEMRELREMVLQLGRKEN